MLIHLLVLLLVSLSLKPGAPLKEEKTLMQVNTLPVGEPKAAEAAIPKLLYGTASYYANKFEGRKTANGEIYSHSKLTAACNVLPLGTWIRITNLRNQRVVTVKVNDRLHPRMTRITDLSVSAAQKLGYTKAGLTKVKVEVLGKKKPA